MQAPSIRDYERLLARVYGRDPAFVHPDVRFLSRVLSGRAAFLRHGRARAFGVDGEAFAVAFADPRLEAKTGRAVGTIGFFEATTLGSARAVLDPACEWLATQGVTEVWGPFNANPFFGVGLREDRFDEPPFLGCGHQPSTYCSFLEAAGFIRSTGYLNFEIDLAGEAWRGPSSDVPGVTFREASRARFREDVARFMTMHNDAFRGVWGESDLTSEEAWERLGRARFAFVPPLFLFAEQEGEAVGFVLCMPDVNEVIAPHRSRLTSPSGVWRMTSRRRRVTTVGLLALGVRPDLHGHGIGTALVARACGAASELGYRRVEYALVAESNEASKSTVARFGGKLCRRFGVYAKEL